jgi:hypothetical protein
MKPIKKTRKTRKTRIEKNDNERGKENGSTAE